MPHLSADMRQRIQAAIDNRPEARFVQPARNPCETISP
jgi:hypothetical protein